MNRWTTTVIAILACLPLALLAGGVPIPWLTRGDVRATVLAVPPGDRELAWLHTTTNAATWERFVAGVKRATLTTTGLDVDDANAFPDGTMPTLVPVHPTALYEAAFAFALAGLLWWARSRVPPLAVFGLYAALSGTARFLVEELRINDEVALSLTAPQLWSLVLVAIGAALLVGERKRPTNSGGVTESRADTQGAESRVTETSST